MNESIPPLALRLREAAKTLGISPRLLWQLTKDGKRKTVLYPVTALQAWLSRESNTAKEGG